MNLFLLILLCITINIELSPGQVLEKVQPVRVNEIIPSVSRSYLNLSGIWQFQLDPENKGEEEQWFKGEINFNDQIIVPGCLEAQGKGLTYLPLTQPRWAGTCDKPYLGTSWYKTGFKLPEVPAAKDIFLNFGGVMTDCKIWLNGQYVGEHHYASVPFGFNITRLVKPDSENILVVMVQNNQTYSSKTPENTHGFGTTTMEMRWSGIFRDVEIVVRDQQAIADLFLIPDITKGSVRCQYRISGMSSQNKNNLRVTAEVTPWQQDRTVGTARQPVSDGAQGTIEVVIAEPRLWFDYDPFLYKITLTLLDENNRIIDDISSRFGLREFSSDGEFILLNKKPIYLRGEMCHIHWPNTISPATMRDDIREKLQVYKDYGFNFSRHHTHFPSPEHLDVCDELGILNQNELNVVNGSMVIPEEHREAMWNLLVQRDKNHPSVMVWGMGNERNAAKWQIEKFSRLTFAVDTTRFLLTNSPGWILSANKAPFRLPVHHEYRRAGASYIDTDYAANFQNSPLRAWRVLYAKQQTQTAGIDSLLPVFTRHTELLQARSRKILLEQVRLNDQEICDNYNLPGINYMGYQLATFRDGGSFIWGVVDDHFKPKIIPPEQLTDYNAPSVLLWVQHWSRRTFFSGTTAAHAYSMSKGQNRVMPVFIKCSHFGAAAIENATLEWKIQDENDTVYKTGLVQDVHLEIGENRLISSDYFFLPEITRPLKMTLHGRLSNQQIMLKNSWDFWIFPRIVQDTRAFEPDVHAFTNPVVPVAEHLADREFAARLSTTYPFITALNKVPKAEAVVITDVFDQSVVDLLRNGHSVLLIGRNHFDGHVTEWGAGRSEFARGTKIYSHPLLDRFPHDGWCDIPFSNMISGSENLHGNRNQNGVMIDMAGWPKAVLPVVMGFPSYKDENPQLYALLLEAAVGKGKLLTTTFDMTKTDPAAIYLMDQMLRYVSGNAFNPKAAVDIEFFTKKLGKPAQINAHVIEFRRGIMPNLERPDEK